MRTLPRNLVAFVLAASAAHAACAQVTWNINSTTSVGGFTPTVIGSPTVVATPFGDGLRFDGNDGLIVPNNPIAGAANFTIEMLLRPNANVVAPLDQPRILHVQSNSPTDHRATLEGRMTGSQWYVDTFLRAPATANPNTIASLTLIDATKLHAADAWYSYALVYDGAQMRTYLNGQIELAGALAIQPLAAGQTSLGMRFNQVNFYSGDIAQVRFSTTALPADQLLSNRVPGDYNGDFFPGGAVDSDDLAVWNQQLGAAGPFPMVGDNADGDRDGDVDGGDFLLWQRGLNANSAGPFHAVPEPRAVGLMLVGVCQAIACCRRYFRASLGTAAC